ncbi:recombinase family protein [Bacillus xiapuensis]|uniref:Recombinase family protein n=1 Tax=Bacillus xiapuensis TaxID=2014075 RepID=A0ABU6NBZ4_9BACI|nr:recombinase family protein [Bacillus xiapuensis]
MESALCYNRKSRGELTDLLKHKEELLDYCKRNNYKPTYFEEIASSVDDEREEYLKLINEIKSGKYHILVLTDLSRLTRDLEQQIKLFKLLTKHKMVIHSLLDGKIDPAEKTNKMLGVIKGLFNDIAYEETSEKMHLGRLQSARKGKFIGSPPYGYKKNKDMVLIPDEIEAPIVRRIFREVKEGYALTDIMNRLTKDGIRTRKGNIFHVGTISDLIARRTYIGEMKFKSEKFEEEIYLKNTHEPLVSLEDFIAVREIMAKRQQFKTRSHPVTSPLDKLVVCGKCGRFMQINYSKGKYIYIQKCSAYKYGEKCDNRGCQVTMILPRVYNKVKERKSVIKERLNQLYNGSSSERVDRLKQYLKGLEKRLKQAKSEKDDLINYLLKKVISEVVYATKNKELEDEIKQLQQQIDDTQEAIASSNVKNEIEYLEGLLEHIDGLETKPVDEQNRILRHMIDKIIFLREGDNIELGYKFNDE